MSKKMILANRTVCVSIANDQFIWINDQKDGRNFSDKLRRALATIVTPGAEVNAGTMGAVCLYKNKDGEKILLRDGPVPLGKGTKKDDAVLAYRAAGWRVSIDESDGVEIWAAPSGPTLAAQRCKKCRARVVEAMEK